MKSKVILLEEIRCLRARMLIIEANLAWRLEKGLQTSPMEEHYHALRRIERRLWRRVEKMSQTELEFLA